MLKYALLAGVVSIATPVIGQETPVQSAPTVSPQTTPAPAQTNPASPAVTDRESDMPARSAADTTTVEGGTPTPPPEAVPAPAPAAPATQPTAAAGPATSATQIAAIVDQEFPTYDVNHDGSLSTAEFGTWMVVLKQKSDPSTVANSPTTLAWLSKAFAQADTDRSSALSKAELIAFLNPAQS